MDKPKLICVVGPTASGKTRLAIRLAREIDGEIISCDSMQIYRGMDVGTAKPTAEERTAAVHHMIDVVSPEEDYSAARYAQEAGSVLQDLLSRGKTPILAGGTGLYLDALTGGMRFASRSEDPALRLALGELSSEALMEKLRQCDPESAGRLHPADRKRIIRALEVFAVTGETISAHNAATRDLESPYELLKIGLCWTPREQLYARIELRVDQMLQEGWLEETRRLLEDGIPAHATALQAIGYRELQQVLQGELEPETAAALIKQNTRRYAKRQLSWFCRDDKTLWLDAGASSWEEVESIAVSAARRFLQPEKGAHS